MVRIQNMRSIKERTVGASNTTAEASVSVAVDLCQSKVLPNDFSATHNVLKSFGDGTLNQHTCE
jgi:hypothetical protein